MNVPAPVDVAGRLNVTVEDVTAVTMELFATPVPDACHVYGATVPLTPDNPEITATPPTLAIVPLCAVVALVVKSYSRIMLTQPPCGRRASSSPASLARFNNRIEVSSVLPTMDVGTATGAVAAADWQIDNRLKENASYIGAVAPATGAAPATPCIGKDPAFGLTTPNDPGICGAI